MNGRYNLHRRALLASLAIVLLGIIAYLLVLAADGAEFLKGTPRTVVNYHAEPWLIAATVLARCWFLADGA